jgi:dipeptidyl aminopeptidase/acylaminoacyl peptidase
MRYLSVLLALAGLVLLSDSSRAQGWRAMTLDDLLTAVRVAEPHLSPDGRSVAYVRTTTHLESGRRNGDIFIVPADGSAAPRLFAGSDRSESTPRFSPDGAQVAFISSRDGARRCTSLLRPAASRNA